MTAAWISLSTRWDLASVQAALNVVISILGTVGIWAFSRYWWQRCGSRILRGKADPLSTLFTVAGPGDGWDAIAVLRRRIFNKENWRLLLQLFVVTGITLATMLSGPIAKVSLRSTLTVQSSRLEVLETANVNRSTANLQLAQVLWNDTIQSLDRAEFPNDQLLDYLPTSTADWTYVSREWNPTWSMVCNYTAETVLHNVTSSGNYTFYEPIEAFPVFADTYDPPWLGASNRREVYYFSWQNFSDPVPIKDVLFFVLIQSDPATDDRMNTNNETMHLSMSVLHAQNFGVSKDSMPGQASSSSRKPMGPVGNASYTRVECDISRKPEVSKDTAVPWIWTNDTLSIAMGYASFWVYPMEETDSKHEPVSTPTPEVLLRFYQAYMVTVNTIDSFPSLRRVSVWMDTVQLSVVFLAVIIALTLLTIGQTGRYFCFLRRHKSRLSQVYIPDGKLEWMIHPARVSAFDAGEQTIKGKPAKDRDHFTKATFGYINTDLEKSDAGLQRPSIARVYTGGASISGASPSSVRGSVSKGIWQENLNPPTVHEEKDEENSKAQEETDGHDGKSSPSLPHLDEKMFDAQISGKSSTDGSQPSVHFEKR
ncbi:uncharacterized protein PAC_12645 [Phialocephala subalpina]|uniref:Uncharacterized protein n=1 Tax=Phialocephala subalpina TaxID=576137 RepID=A0A1L7XCK7_9HELO|nr:uncharacterized protein PAC_12645 [Phialocephala subalpina]